MSSQIISFRHCPKGASRDCLILGIRTRVEALYVAVSGVSFFISELVDGHRQKFHAFVEVVVNVRSSGAFDVQCRFTEGFRAGLTTSQIS